MSWQIGLQIVGEVAGAVVGGPFGAAIGGAIGSAIGGAEGGHVVFAPVVRSVSEVLPDGGDA